MAYHMSAVQNDVATKISYFQSMLTVDELVTGRIAQHRSLKNKNVFKGSL